MRIQRDGNGSLFVQWKQGETWAKRAWVQHKADPEKDWARTGRYLNVVRCNQDGNPGGNPTDFPIYNDLPDEQILRAFVESINAITGCKFNGEG